MKRVFSGSPSVKSRDDKSIKNLRAVDQPGREHAILERGQADERWPSARWDSFCFQFPNSTIELPGYRYQSEDPDGFARAGKSFDSFKNMPIS
jgi:cation diffusion facilitator CzcD-associated flavoprotein CzcO